MDRALAMKAHKLSKRPGMDGPTLAKGLGVKYARDAWHLASVGRAVAAIDDAKLTDSELLVLRCLAAEHRAELERGQVASPKGKWVSARARRSYGWAASVVGKRMDSHRKGEEEGRPGSGLNLVAASRNGHMWMRPAGWALVHAIEAEEAVAQNARRAA